MIAFGMGWMSSTPKEAFWFVWIWGETVETGCLISRRGTGNIAL
jgi:hypothetical protein